jgi:hypothetical protein
MNMGTAKKDKMGDKDEDEDIIVKGLGKGEEQRLRKMNNSSGFFVFNEDDMKSMTEFSPKGKTGIVNIREIKFNLEDEEDEEEYMARDTVGAGG